MIAIELSDVGLMVARDGALCPLDGQRESPGYALAIEGAVLFGQAAKLEARIYPTKSNARYFDQLNSQGLRPNFGPCVSNAEIAFRHLEKICEQLPSREEPVVLAVPGHYGREPLGLLIGMAAELSLPVVGVIDRGLAMAPEPHETMTAVLDLHLHRGSLSLIRPGESQQVMKTIEIPLGLQHLMEDTIQYVADIFVHETRFDPLHEARNEQVLFDRVLDVWTGLAREAEWRFDMALGGRTHSVMLERAAFNKRCGRLAVTVREALASLDSATPLFISHRAALLPAETFPADRSTFLPAGAGALGAIRAAQAMPDLSVEAGAVLISQRRKVELETQPPAPSESSETPTHIVYHGRAIRIQDGLTVGREGADVVVRDVKGISRTHCQFSLNGGGVTVLDKSSYGSWLGDQRLGETPVAVRAGQVLTLAKTGESLLFVAVEGGA